MLARGTLLILLLTAVAVVAPAAATAKQGSAPSGFVSLRDVDRSILLDIRYFTKHNFVGRRIRGYSRGARPRDSPASRAPWCRRATRSRSTTVTARSGP
jgi:zinc D-Ala-D-Ala dipeptidase